MSDDMSTTDDPNTARSIRLVAPGPSPAPAPDPADVRELVEAAREALDWLPRSSGHGRRLEQALAKFPETEGE